MKIKFKDSDIICPQCHMHLEVDGNDLRYEEDDFWTDMFYFTKQELKRIVDESSALKDNLKFKEKVLDELLEIAPLAKKSDMVCIYGGEESSLRVYVKCPVCGKDITIVSAETNRLNVTAPGENEILNGEEYYHAEKTYGFDNTTDKFSTNFTFGKKYTELYGKLLACGYHIH